MGLRTLWTVLTVPIFRFGSGNRRSRKSADNSNNNNYYNNNYNNYYNNNYNISISSRFCCCCIWCKLLKCVLGYHLLSFSRYFHANAITSVYSDAFENSSITDLYVYLSIYLCRYLSIYIYIYIYI